MFKSLFTAVSLLAFSSLAHAVHYDVRVGTSNGPVAGSKISIDFYGDLDLAGKLPVDGNTGYKLYPGYFDDLEGGSRLTDDPGFQSFSGAFGYGDTISFRALGSLSYWDPQSSTWGTAHSASTVTLFGAIPTDVWINHMMSPNNPTYTAQYNYYANGTVFSANGISGPETAVIDAASRNGTFHSHLDWKLSDSASLGVYALTIQLWSPTLENGVQKYIDSDPFHVIFKTAGVSQAQFDEAFGQRIAVAVPEADTWAMMLIGLGMLGFASRRKRQ